MSKTYYAVNGYTITPCHLIMPKDRDSRGKYAANSKRDKRRFHIAYETLKEAEAKVIEYEARMKNE